jgi:hypothetical protein
VDKFLERMEKWALLWLRGSLASYFKGKTTLVNIEGRIRKAVRDLGVKLEDVEALVTVVVGELALSMPREALEERAKPLLEFIKGLKKG